MSRGQLGILSLALLAVLAFPSAGHASIWDIIWGMSGPRMIGVVLHCEVDLEHKSADPEDLIECRGLDYLFYHRLKPRPMRRVWLSLDAGYYSSTGKDSDGNQFDWFKNHMVAFEPILEVRSYTSPGENFMLHHGLMGVTYDVLWGKNVLDVSYDTFDNVGLKFRPVGVTVNKKYNASFTLRYYPRRFTSEDFGIINPTQDKTEGEWVYGFTLGWLWRAR
jgi:hypothetical protein